MYLEVYVFNSSIVTEEQIYNEETLSRFPSNEVLKKEIEAKIPDIIWLDEETGQIDVSNFKGLLILGNAKENKIIYLKIAGGSNPFEMILELCRTNGWTAYTPENSNILDLNMDSLMYWQEYKTYKGIIDDVFYNEKNLDRPNPS